MDVHVLGCVVTPEGTIVGTFQSQHAVELNKLRSQFLVADVRAARRGREGRASTASRRLGSRGPRQQLGRG